MGKKYYAHTLEGRPPKEWQSLGEHIKSEAVRVLLSLLWLVRRAERGRVRRI